ncbi:MAG TPA: hypothetical protein VKS81_08345, partial [Bacteroidota bacterium]|nr:hypothetical protein [Bacteroidota bacterium]
IVFLLLAVTWIARAEQSKVLTLLSDVKPDDRIELSGISGSDITLRTWDKNQISIRLKISISCSDRDYENEYIAKAMLHQSGGGGVVHVELEEPSSTGGSGIFSILHRYYLNKAISGEIYIPRDNPLTTDFRYGAMDLTDMKGELHLMGTNNNIKVGNCPALREIENNYGTTTIENSGGDLRLSSTSSTISINNFNGAVDISANYSVITANKIAKELSISDQSGTLKTYNIGGALTLNANYSTINGGDVNGAVSITCASGSIGMSNIRGKLAIDAKYSTVSIDSVTAAGTTSTIIGASGSFTLTNSAGNLRIDNPYSKIYLERVTGNIDCNTTSGTIEIVDVEGDFKAQAPYTPIRCRNLRAKNVVVTDESNDVNLQLATVPAFLQVRCRYSPIYVDMPKGFSGDIEMTVEYGKIITNFPIKNKELSSSAYGTAKIGSGTNSINIETSSANIELREAER